MTLFSLNSGEPFPFVGMNTATVLILLLKHLFYIIDSTVADKRGGGGVSTPTSMDLPPLGLLHHECNVTYNSEIKSHCYNSYRKLII